MSTTSSLAEGNYSPTSPLDLPYPYTASSIYPDRPIRPLPKRRLRSRLSADVVDSILFPQTPSSPISGNTDQNKNSKPDKGELEKSGRESQQYADAGRESYQFRGSEASNGTEEAGGVENRYQQWRQKPTSYGTGSARGGHIGPRNENQRHVKASMPPSAASSADSVDGYDSFENTNNKKKRKIPISGSLGNHHSSLSADLAHMDISSRRDIDVSQVDGDVSAGQFYESSNGLASAPPPNNIAGSGKHRFGRPPSRRHSGRSPLGPSINGSNAAQPGQDYGTKQSAVSGEISKPDITNSQAPEFRPRTSTTGHVPENGRIQAQHSKKNNSTKTQFTFTCGSESSKNMTWPGYGYGDGREESLISRGGGQTGRNTRGMATQGTQTSPSIADHANQPQSAVPSPPANQQPRKPRRSLAKQLAIAARERRLQQDYENYNNPPKDDKLWLCEFCEYESIFGHPPEALIRQYEIKDRRERRRLAEKRRLLEKAKMKNKKGKKGSKNNKNANVTQAQQQNLKQRSDAQAMDSNALQSPDNQSEEYILDEYDDDEPLVHPNTTPQPPSRIPQPVNQNHGHSVRPPGGSASTSVAGGGP